MDALIANVEVKGNHNIRKKFFLDWGIKYTREDIRDRIVLEREAGLSFQDIANKLNSELVPTASGKTTWYKSTVRHLYLRNINK